uniref:MFS domain-containing protein n=1 Tax=Rhabditophanes sp. KR3021 TaxID=114890 RepID=A0AC35TTW0_9BILA
MVCMDNDNSTEKLPYDDKDMNYFFSIVAIGNIAGAIPCEFMITHLGTKNAVSIYLMISIVSTFLLPYALQTSYWYGMTLRFFQGFSWAITLIASGTTTYSWSTLSAGGVYMTSLSLHGQIAPLFTSLVSGQLCAHGFGSWSIFYFHAIVSICCLCIYYTIHSDEPENNRFIPHGSAEIYQIKEGKDDNNSKDKNLHLEPVPYAKALFNPTLLLGNASYLVFFFGFHLWLHFNQKLNFDVGTTGIVVGLPYIVAIVCKFFAGYMSDRGCNCLSPVLKLKFLHGSTQLTVGVSFIVMGMFATQFPVLDIICFTIQVSAGAMVSGSIFKICQLVSRQHFHFIMAICSIANSVALIIVPTLARFIMPEYELMGYVDVNVVAPFWNDLGKKAIQLYKQYYPKSTAITVFVDFTLFDGNKLFGTIVITIQISMLHRAKFIISGKAISSAPASRDYRDYIRDTWKKTSEPEIPVVFVCGKGNYDLKNEESVYQDILQLDFIDSYKNLTLKMMGIYDYFIKNSQVEEIIVINDDTIVNATSLKELTRKKYTKPTMIGKVSRGYPRLFFKWLPWYVSSETYKHKCYPPFIQGSSFIINRPAAQLIHDNICRFPFVHLDDVFMGIITNCLEIKNQHEEGFDHHWLTEFVVFHYQYSRYTANQMRSFWKQIQNKL